MITFVAKRNGIGFVENEFLHNMKLYLNISGRKANIKIEVAESIV
jgi:hypothetical protein